MHNKTIVHILTKDRMERKSFVSEIDAMEELSEKYGIKNVIFYKGDKIKFNTLISKLEKFHILLKNYSNKDDLKEQVINLNKEYEVVFVSSPMELLVKIMNEVMVVLGCPISDNPDIFRDKYLQREFIQVYNPELGVKFLKGKPEELSIKNIEEKIGYPFIIKPTNGLQSAGVERINNRNDFDSYIKNYQEFHERLKIRGVDNKVLIVEEFIDGKIYSIDYFVTSLGKSIISKPVKVNLGIDIGINDYCNVSRIITQKTEDEFKGKRMKIFINSTVKACGIRNTFVHHEFKINSKGELKTIELNGRIGGGRLEAIKQAYNLNLYELIINPNLKPGVLKYNIIAVNIYATKKGILRGFNEKLLNDIQKRSTVYSIEKEENYLGKEIGLTKHGFVKVGLIKLKSKDYNEIKKDYLYVKKNYLKLLEIE